MLTVDLSQLQRSTRLEIDEVLAPGDPFFNEVEAAPAAPLEVRLEAQQLGPDVLVRGRLSGAFEHPCRRCLVAVRVPVDEEVAFLYREGLDPVRAEDEEAYPLPARGRMLDLAPAVREHLLLAVPEFVECEAACRGLCPQCGVNRNTETCNCSQADVDERWAALRKLGSE